MVLTVTSYGLALKKAGDCIEAVSKEGSSRRVPISQVEELVVAAPCSISSEVISLCIKHRVPLTYVDRRGRPLWYTEAFEQGSTPLLHRRQLQLAEEPAGSVLATTLLGRKLQARVELLLRLAANRRDERGEALRASAAKVEEIQAKIAGLPPAPICSLRESLQGYEGTAGRVYFAALAAILPAEAAFAGRERGPEAGPFNQLLNYGYGVLYRELLHLCYRVRLNPYLGVMHTDSYNSPTLTYDLIEPFRVAVEETVCKLFTKHQVRVDSHFTVGKKGLTLSSSGRKLLLEKLDARLRKGYRREMEALVRGLAKGLAAWKEQEVEECTGW